MSNRFNNRYCGVRALVLGASGFVGRWVARALGTLEADLYLVVHHRATAEDVFSEYGIRGDIFERDLRDADVVCRLYQEIRPSITFNLVGYGIDRTERDEETAYEINAHLVQSICEAVADTRDPGWPGQDLVHVGSAFEYGALDNDLSEDSQPRPTTLYGKSKLAGTQVLARHCQTSGVHGLTARLFTIYGPGEHPGRLLPSLLETAETGEKLLMTAGKHKRDFTYVEDVVEGLLCLGLIKAQPGEIVNLATGKLTSVRGFVEIAAQVLRIPDESLEFGALPTRVEEMEHAPVTNARLLRLTGWVPSTSIEEGVRRTKDFVAKHADT